MTTLRARKKRLTVTLKKFAKFSTDFMADGRGNQEQAERNGMQSLKGMLRKPPIPVTIEQMDLVQNQKPIRKAGALKGKLRIAADFDAPLPDDLQDEFNAGPHRRFDHANR